MVHGIANGFLIFLEFWNALYYLESIIIERKQTMIRIVLRVLRFIGGLVGGILGLLLFIVCIPYVFCPVYHFPEPRPFQGDVWYNPYAQMEGQWYKANFHAHAHSWGGSTSGRDRPDDLYTTYRDMGYDIIGVSNYMSIFADTASDPLAVPVYEHGYNAMKSHQICIGAKKVNWLDYTLGLNLHHKQHILNVLGRSSAYVVLPIPISTMDTCRMIWID